jgi:metal-responsive CopG/Arc/MetJ family transcriptional regulator
MYIRRKMRETKKIAAYSLSPDILERIDEMRGQTSRSSFVEMLIRLGIEEYKKK